MTRNADAALLSLLRANARESVSELARKLGVSRSTVQSRIERLEQPGCVICPSNWKWRRSHRTALTGG